LVLIICGSSCLSMAQQLVPFSWCMDKPLTKLDTLALIRNKVKRIRVYEISMNDSSGKVPRYSFDTASERSAYFEWSVLYDSSHVKVTFRDDRGRLNWRILKTSEKNNIYTRDEYTNDKVLKLELYLKFTAWKDSAGIFTNAERRGTMIRKGRAENYGTMYKENYEYEKGLLKEIVFTFYDPPPKNKEGGKCRLVFFYE
jgi:hypothetical protein